MGAGRGSTPPPEGWGRATVGWAGKQAGRRAGGGRQQVGWEEGESGARRRGRGRRGAGQAGRESRASPFLAPRCGQGQASGSTKSGGVPGSAARRPWHKGCGRGASGVKRPAAAAGRRRRRRPCKRQVRTGLGRPTAGAGPRGRWQLGVRARREQAGRSAGGVGLSTSKQAVRRGPEADWSGTTVKLQAVGPARCRAQHPRQRAGQVGFCGHRTQASAPRARPALPGRRRRCKKQARPAARGRARPPRARGALQRRVKGRVLRCAPQRGSAGSGRG
jgi:hypothetical protein